MDGFIGLGRQKSIGKEVSYFIIAVFSSFWLFSLIILINYLNRPKKNREMSFFWQLIFSLMGPQNPSEKPYGVEIGGGGAIDV